ncbi:imidazoleglycerol-phosphate dehydratase HisB [Ruminococcaceae bacterium OttesenSCG-928-D13]|nr:imidazoleglycerol-phosphate dehydratase HisB [Ruminococcaceae bacterium OttesenSCG-928-D13]
MAERVATVERKTNETDIRLTLNLDGTGKCECATGIEFFDHMIDGFTRHGLFDLALTCNGDLAVDCHHTVEDCGIALGEALKQAVGDKRGICRYGSCLLPMDEALVSCAVDLSGRPFFVSDVVFTMPRIGGLDTEMVREFFYAVSYSAGINLHFVQHRGSNNHHLAEASFKAFARALDAATRLDPRVTGVPSTKGAL